MKSEITLEQYVEMYYSELDQQMNSFIKYIDLIMDESMYYMQIYGIHEDKFIEEDYNNKLDNKEVINICFNILNELDNNYSLLFKEYLCNRVIKYKKNKKFSYMNSKNIVINKTNTVEDIFTTIHEFFHKVHINMYDNNLKDPEWLFSSELVAILFELYAFFYMYKNDMYKEDLKIYFNRLISAVGMISMDVIHEIIVLNIYDKYKSIDIESMYKFLKYKDIDEEVLCLLNVFETEKKSFRYHKEVPYIFGFIISLISGLNMVYDDNYKDKVLDSFKDINSNSLEVFLKNINMDNILHDKDGEILYNFVENINQFIDTINKKDKITGKELKLERY